MMDNDTNNEFPTNDTSLAAYLVSEGFTLLIIVYSPSRHRKQQGTFVFDKTDPKLMEFVQMYRRAEAPGDIVRYEHARNGLIDRVKRGLP